MLTRPINYPYNVGKYRLYRNYWIYERVYIFFWKKRVKCDTYLEGIKEVNRLARVRKE